MATLVFDSEVYSNYFLALFKNIDTQKHQAFEMYDGRLFDVAGVRRLLQANEIVTFNGNSFDMPILGAALAGATCAQIKAKCDQIIVHDQRPWQIGLEAPLCDHIDLIEVAPGQASLKIYGGRMHCPTMQDLPIEPNAMISPEQRDLLKRYCLNDLDITERLYRRLIKQIDLRRKMSEQYAIDLRSKSDAQIAEAVIYQAVTLAREGDAPPRKVPVRPGTIFKYSPPDFIRCGALDFVRQCEFVIADSGAPQCSALEDHKVTIGDSVYRMGIGGLHSSEKSVAHLADDEYLLVDRDVNSYYPSIISVCQLFPRHFGSSFLSVYNAFIRERLAAKHGGNKTVADTFKIFLNGSFGKLGSKYSCLYSPDLLIQVTLTGQLALLMLIEAIEKEGIHVVSANTDGIVIKCPRRRKVELDSIIAVWEFWTGFETEEAHYRALYSRDVNNYVAIKPDGSIKTKGIFAGSGLQKSPAGEIVTEAVVAHLVSGAPIEDTVIACQDVTKFLTVRTVTGGAVDQNGDYIGKAVRWYIGRGREGALHYKKNGNKVGSSDGAVPCLTLPDTLPNDIDYDHYIKAAYAVLKSIGA